ncbi:hypothetical protein GN325_20780 [Agrobacterium vitis]|uniref:hypothetical protein n=1 Tax=Agrobacterium vitis TaxID=373 RepID=UPI0012E87700|nr:hypothetical protein [Agrobacterium vitis]MVB04203.1 hypothetical protein [Agrobacterium vitis]
MIITNEIIAKLKEDMGASPVDDITTIDRKQLEELEAALSAQPQTVAVWLGPDDEIPGWSACPCCGGSGHYGDAARRSINGEIPADIPPAALTTAPAQEPLFWLSTYEIGEIRMPASSNRHVTAWRQPSDNEGRQLIPLYLTPPDTQAYTDALERRLDIESQALCNMAAENIKLKEIARTAIMKPDQSARIAELEAVISKINDIRNCIIGTQSLNWSEHVYPLVAALNKAGFTGMEYPEARKYFGTMLERTVTAEDRSAELEAALEPFAQLAQLVLAETPSEATGWDAHKSCEGVVHQMSLAHLRNAVAILDKGKAK